MKKIVCKYRIFCSIPGFLQACSRDFKKTDHLNYHNAKSDNQCDKKVNSEVIQGALKILTVWEL